MFAICGMNYDECYNSTNTFLQALQIYHSLVIIGYCSLTQSQNRALGTVPFYTN